MNKMLTGYQEQYPEYEFVLAEYFGYHPKLQTILKERVREAMRRKIEWKSRSRKLSFICGETWSRTSSPP